MGFYQRAGNNTSVKESAGDSERVRAAFSELFIVETLSVAPHLPMFDHYCRGK